MKAATFVAILIAQKIEELGIDLGPKILVFPDHDRDKDRAWSVVALDRPNHGPIERSHGDDIYTPQWKDFQV